MRKIVIVVLILVSAWLVALGNLIFWAGHTLVKHDRFVAATAPIIKDQAVQQSIARYTTNAVFNNVDAEAKISEALPPRFEFLAPQLAEQAKKSTETVLKKVVARPEFQDRWNKIVSNQHQRLINFVAAYDQGSGEISLNDLYNQLAAKLKDTKLAFLADKQLPPRVGTLTVVNASWLPTAHNIVVHLDTWRLLSILGLIILMALAIWLSRGKRSTIYAFVATVVGLMLLTLISLWLARGLIVDRVDAQYAEGVSHALHIILGSLVAQTWVIILVFITLGLSVWLLDNARHTKAAVK